MMVLPPQLGVYGAFCLYALALGAIFPRLGDLQLRLGISETTLGLTIIGAAFGAQISFIFADRVLRLVGLRIALLAGIVMIGSAEILASMASRPLVLFGWFFVAGLAIGIVEVAVNVEADRVENRIGRRIMNRCHAFWSFGFFGTGLIGAFVAQLGVAVPLHLAGVLAMTLGLGIWLLHSYQPAPPRASEEGQAVQLARPTKPILALVALTLSAMLLEAAGIDWSVIFMRDVFATSPLVNGLALALGAFSQFLVRFFADSQVEKFGPERVVRWSILALGLGVLLVGLSPHPVVALLGFISLGAGNAAIFPLAISAAAQRTDRPAAVNVAALAQLTFVIFLISPPLLGFVAEHFGIRWSFGLGLPLVVLSWLSVRALRPAG